MSPKPLLQDKQPQLSQLPSIAEVLQPCEQLISSLDSFQQVHVAHVLGTPDLDNPKTSLYLFCSPVLTLVLGFEF